MRAMASQITRLSVVYSTVYSGADQQKCQSSTSLAFVRGIRRWPVNSPHKRPVTRKMFPFDDVIMCLESESYLEQQALASVAELGKVHRVWQKIDIRIDYELLARTIMGMHLMTRLGLIRIHLNFIFFMWSMYVFKHWPDIHQLININYKCGYLT